MLFGDGTGVWTEWYPTRIAASAGRLLFGHDAERACGHPSVWDMGSVKRMLGHLGPHEPVAVPGCGEFESLDLLAAFLASLRMQLSSGATNVHFDSDEPLQAMVAVPANSNSNQRYVTLEAFRRAGFEVLGMLDEPSAAGVEYAHRYLKRPEAPRGRQYLAIYDLGGGTFDAAAIRIAGMRHDVVSSEGVGRLGGEDFDRVLYDLVVESSGVDVEDDAARRRLLAECRLRKEALHPNTRRLLVDLAAAGVGRDEVVVDVAEFYERCGPLIGQSLQCLEDVLARLPDTEPDDTRGLPTAVATVYLVGGSTNFPPVARSLRERYGRNVQKSPYPHGAVAIGLAVAADPEAQYFIGQTLTRHFGVWREGDSGARIVFDPIFVKDTALDAGEAAPLRAVRRYVPVHNVGHFQYLEAGALAPDGTPAADVAVWRKICFALDPSLAGTEAVDEISVEHVAYDPGHVVEEEYTCDAAGIVRVTLRHAASRFERQFVLTGPATNGGKDR